jgi:hypothetical protein
MRNLMRYTSGHVYEAPHGRPCITEVNVVEISVGSRILPPDPDNIASLIESYQHTKQITPLKVRAI